MRTIVTLVPSVFLVPVLLIAQGGGAPQSGARSLFYDPVSGQALSEAAKQRAPQTGQVAVKRVAAQDASKVKYVGVHYWIELEGKGPVADTHTFKSGDRVRVHIRSNVDGYLSLWSLDPKGEGRLLFPTDQSSGGLVKADSDYPTPGWIRFSPPAQDERLLLFFSKSTSDTPSSARTPAVTPSKEVAEKTLKTGSRSLVFETDEKTPGEIGTYVVNKDGGPVAREVLLKHVPQ